MVKQTLIAVVDDIPMNVAIITKRLEALGFKVCSAVNGHGAYRIAKSENPDLMLLDIKMPLADGWQAISLIKSDPETKMIPIIAVSANIKHTDPNKLKSAGFDDWILKPIKGSDLVEKIKKWIVPGEL